jgi:hypothetical protein
MNKNNNSSNLNLRNKMKNNAISFAIVASLILIACNATVDNKTTNQENMILGKKADMPYKTANNYFVKNTYKDGELENPKITTQADFENIFGMATTMGVNGKPTPIDFSKEYVIAIIGAITDNATTININNVNKIANIITVTYTETKGEKQSYTIRPFQLIIVNNQYQGEVKLQQK